MQSTEEKVLVAVLDGDDSEAKKLIAGMLPNERLALRSAAIKLESMAAGNLSLPDALTSK